MTRVLLLGANGQVGTELRAILNETYEVYSLTRAEADFSQPDQVGKVVAELQPAIIFNTAAYTAVDRAESEPELALLVNATTPEAIAREAARYGGLLIHYSTDYVFDGSKDIPWVEDDETGPLNVYGSTKLAGERAIAAAGGDFLIFRTSWVYAAHGKNFLLTILRLAREREKLNIVADQKGAPTSALAIARATKQALQALAIRGPAAVPSGVFHMTCAGETTWHGFAEAIVKEGAAALEGKRPEVLPIPGSQYPTPAGRPANSVLDNGKLSREFGIALPHWRSALVETLSQLPSVERTLSP